jgi:hypothetical protein
MRTRECALHLISFSMPRSIIHNWCARATGSSPIKPSVEYLCMMASGSDCILDRLIFACSKVARGAAFSSTPANRHTQSTPDANEREQLPPLNKLLRRRAPAPVSDADPAPTCASHVKRLLGGWWRVTHPAFFCFHAKIIDLNLRSPLGNLRHCRHVLVDLFVKKRNLNETYLHEIGCENRDGLPGQTPRSPTKHHIIASRRTTTVLLHGCMRLRR